MALPFFPIVVRPIAFKTSAMSQEQFASFVRNEIPRWREIVRNANIDIQTVPAQ